MLGLLITQDVSTIIFCLIFKSWKTTEILTLSPMQNTTRRLLWEPGVEINFKSNDGAGAAQKTAGICYS
jgi:hypothetical protein